MDKVIPLNTDRVFRDSILYQWKQKKNNNIFIYNLATFFFSLSMYILQFDFKYKCAVTWNHWWGSFVTVSVKRNFFLISPFKTDNFLFCILKMKLTP